MFHFSGDDDRLVEHYSRYGYECVCIWEDEVYDYSMVDELLHTKGFI